MEYRTLGESDLKVSVIGFGAWAVGGWMWGGSDDRDAIRAIKRAIDEGMTLIDTAPIYGMGHSEKIVGEAIKGRRDDVIIATKCGMRWDLAEGERFFETRDNAGEACTIYKNLRPHSLEYEVETSLSRMNIDCIDLYQCHWPDSTTSLDDTMAALLKLRDIGKIRHIGVSNFTAAMIDKCLKHGPVASDQPKYNALERDAELDVIPFCREHNVGILAYSPLAQGLLTGKVTADRVFPETDTRAGKALFTRDNRERVNQMLEEVRPIAQAHDCTLGQLFLAWTIAQPGVTAALAGARMPEQVAENAAAARVKLNRKELLAIREQVVALGRLAAVR